jgi:hypothetical protein
MWIFSLRLGFGGLLFAFLLGKFEKAGGRATDDHRFSSQIRGKRSPGNILQKY